LACDNVGPRMVGASPGGRGRALAVAAARGALDAPAAGEVRRVVAGERRDLDHVAGMRRVDELPTADVDPDVAGTSEEHEVARLQLADRNRSAHAELRIRAVRERDADLGKHIRNEAGAVEATRRRAAPDVRNAEIAHRDSDHPTVD